MSANDMTGVVHIVGTVVDVGTRTRQCCAWCGVVLLDYDLAGLVTPVDLIATAPPHFPSGALLAVDGDSKVVLSTEANSPLPDNVCAAFTPSVAHLAELERITRQIDTPCPKRWGDSETWPYPTWKCTEHGAPVFHQCQFSSMPHSKHLCRCGVDPVDPAVSR